MRGFKQIIADQVDIYQYPDRDAAHVADSKAQLTIGDLHANPIKLLHVLVRQGVIRISPDNYNSLVSIYRDQTNPLTRTAYEEYKRILGTIEFNENSVDLVRLIGDELADRGRHDLLVLALLDAMQTKGVPYTILLSNHGVEFVECYEKEKVFGKCILNFSLQLPWHRDNQAISMIMLDRSIRVPGEDLPEIRFIDRADVMGIVNRVYKPHLKLLDYSFEDEGLGITLLSHAAIDLLVIQSLARKLGVTYQDETAYQLAKSINEINRVFEGLRDTNQINTLYSREGLSSVGTLSTYAQPETIDEYIENYPLEFLLWNRCQGDDQLERPRTHKGYNLSFAHGHHMEVSRGHIFGLDSALGKPGVDSGSYNVLYTQESSTLFPKVYFKLKSMQGLALRPELSDFFAQVEGLYQVANTPAKIRLLGDSISYVYDSLQPNADHASLRARLETLVSRFPVTHHSKAWQKLLISLIVLSSLAALFGALVLGMALAAPASVLVIAPVIGVVTQWGAIASLAAGASIACVAGSGLHKLRQPIEAPIVKSLRFFDKPLKPVVPVSKLVVVSSSGEIPAPSASST